MIENYITIKEVAKRFGLNPMTVKRHIAKGNLKAFRVGTRKIVMTEESVKNWVESNQVRMGSLSSYAKDYKKPHIPADK